VSGVLSVPVRLAGEPVGTLDLYSTRSRTWTTHELEAAAEFATVAGELVTRELELTQLRQALTSRVWIEQAKGVLAATQGLTASLRSGTGQPATRTDLKPWNGREGRSGPQVEMPALPGSRRYDIESRFSVLSGAR
jgi:GAF domain-containing protein